jgi:serine/threonine-protein kinase
VRCGYHSAAPTAVGKAELAVAVTALVPPEQLPGHDPSAKGHTQTGSGSRPRPSTGAPTLPLTAELASGTPVGEYVIEELIGRGGMGLVYRATHPLIGKTVAIKVLTSAVAADPDAHGRFVQEARAVNQIRHKNLIDIFGFGQLLDGRQYYVMEYLEGRALGAYIEELGRLPAGMALPIFHDILRALAAVHDKGIVHRDLKPDNVFLSQEEGIDRPTMKLLDFGVAKLLSSDGDGGVSRTRTGTPVGTPLYMSPEQCLGKHVDARADLYAVGIMLFEALTGRLPFLADTYFELLQQHLTKAPPIASDTAPDVGISAEMDELIARLLEKDPALRYQSAGEALEALEAVAPTMGVQHVWPVGRRATRDQPTFDTGQPGAMPPVPPPAAWRASRSPLIGVVAAVGVLGVGAVAVMLFSNQAQVTVPPDAAAVHAPADAAPAPPDAARPPDAMIAVDAAATARPKPRPKQVDSKHVVKPPILPKAKVKPGDKQFVQPAERPKIFIPQ